MIQYLLYLVEASLCLALFYIIYLLFIQNDTFYKLKRFYLLTSIVLSLVIPELPSATWTTKIETTILPQKTEYIANTVTHDNFGRLLFPVTRLDSINDTSKKFLTGLIVIIGLLYLLGSVFMLVRLSNNFYRIISLIKRNEKTRYRKYKLISLPDDYPTFSFFSYIFLNERNLSDNEKNDVLMHEEIHIKQKHSIDIIFIEICKTLLWFNPVIWLYKNSLLKVHECLADEHLARLKSNNLLDYQSLLLKQYIGDFNIELIHPYNYSFLKFRIMMMTKTKSKWGAKLKLCFALPVIVFSMLAFTKTASELPRESKSSVQEFEDQAFHSWTFWGGRNSAFNISIDNQVSQHGKKSARIEKVKPEYSESVCNLMQRTVERKFSGKRIRVTGYIKSQELTDSAFLWVRVTDLVKKVNSEAGSMLSIGSGDWKKVEMIFDVPEKSEIFYGFWVKGMGKTWIDNVSLDIVNSSIPKTTTAINSPMTDVDLSNTPKDADLKDKPPVNLDFEN